MPSFVCIYASDSKTFGKKLFNPQNKIIFYLWYGYYITSIWYKQTVMKTYTSTCLKYFRWTVWILSGFNIRCWYITFSNESKVNYLVPRLVNKHSLLKSQKFSSILILFGPSRDAERYFDGGYQYIWVCVNMRVDLIIVMNMLTIPDSGHPFLEPIHTVKYNLLPLMHLRNLQ